MKTTVSYFPGMFKNPAQNINLQKISWFLAALHLFLFIKFIKDTINRLLLNLEF